MFDYVYLCDDCIHYHHIKNDDGYCTKNIDNKQLANEHPEIGEYTKYDYEACLFFERRAQED